MLQKFLENHVLANITFAVVLIVGVLSYYQLPRSQDPEINFNWISIVTPLPGASAEDVEKLVTNPLEEAIQQVSDIRFASSNSREGVSSILIRFNELSDRVFDKRISDIRREIQNKANDELPEEADDPLIVEITSANSFPTATIVVRGAANDETLRRAAVNVEEDIERIRGVDNADPAGLTAPELHVDFDPAKLAAYGISASQLADSVSAHFKDISAGDMRIGSQQWLVRLIGADSDPAYLARLPIITAQGETPISSLADVGRGREKAEQLVLQDGKPAVMMAITKKPRTNTLDVVARIREYIDKKNAVLAQLGIEVVLLDDQTTPTRDAIRIMQNNLLLGLILVAFVTWIFLGWKIALFIGIGIPFTLAGTFWILRISEQTLNQPVLLGVVIVLGMLVDDAVVVVEAIYYRVQRGMASLQAAVAALEEVFRPVTASVMTTIAAFLPLMLLPGILGDFMFVIPFVVSVALAVSLVEAYWMLPVHVAAARVAFKRVSWSHRLRVRFTHWLRLSYSRVLIKVLRRPVLSLGAVLTLFMLAGGIIALGGVQVKFFAFDPIRLFYVNVVMPAGSSLGETLHTVSEIERKVRQYLSEHEVRRIASIAGQMFTETEPFFGDNYGQIIISLNPKIKAMRGVEEIVESMRKEVLNTPGPDNLSFLVMSGGPPTSKPINIKVRGDNYHELRAATNALRRVFEAIPAIKDISDDDSPGKQELQLKLDTDAVKRAGLHAGDVARIIRLFFDGEVVATMQDQGEKLEVRVRAKPEMKESISEVLRQSVPLPGGGEIALGQLVNHDTDIGKNNIRHYNFRRAITLEANLDKDLMDTVKANDEIEHAWQRLKLDYPNVDLDFSGELDDIQESLDAMLVLFLFGVGVMYLILGTQFKSYWQPFMILATVPMAFAGVTFGLTVTGNPLSLFTLYGVVALAGISVNAAIVMIDAANTRLQAGMSVLHATIYAARRRVVPIVITSLTTIAGLFSLATGLGGHSLVWSPVASAIVWGLAFSTVLTLLSIPLLYRTFMIRRR